MDKKTITFIIASNRKGTTRSFVLPVAWLKAGSFAAVVMVIILAASAVDYMGLLFQAVENKRLKAENTRLQSQFQIVEGKLNALESSLERVKNFSKKLRLITNVDEEDRELKLAIGPVPRMGQVYEELAEPMSERGPASEMEHQHSSFLEKPPLDLSRKELAIEGQRDYASLAIRIDKSVKETQLREKSILKLWEGLSERKSLLNATPSIRPTKGWFTSRFGYRKSPFTGRPMMHAGVDLAAAPGAPVYAPASGVISYVGYDSGYGKLVAIDHGYNVVTRYGHNSKIFVKVGQKIDRGTVISAVGNTGRSTGPHLHYEVRVNGVPVDPMNYILTE